MFGRMWQTEEIARLEFWWRSGFTVKEIARRLNRSPQACYHKKLREGWEIEPIKRRAMTLERVSQEWLRVPDRRLVRWVKSKKLAAQRIGKRNRQGIVYYDVELDDLVACLENPETWVEWSVAQVVLPDVRRYLAELRREWDQTIIPLKVAARLCNVSVRTMSKRCLRGDYPSAFKHEQRWYVNRNEVLLREAQKGVQ